MNFDIFKPNICLVSELKASWAGNLVNEITPTKVPVEKYKEKYAIKVTHNLKKNWCAVVLPFHKNWNEIDLTEFSFLNFSVSSINNLNYIDVSICDKQEDESTRKRFPRDDFISNAKINILFNSDPINEDKIDPNEEFKFSIKIEDFEDEDSNFDIVESRFLKFTFAEKTDLMLYDIFLS